MKLIYSHLKKFLPDLDVSPQQLRDDITMIGHWTNYFEEIDGEIVFDLDIKVNRGDCLGYLGLAKDLSVLYRLPLSNLVSDFKYPVSNYSLPIKVTTDNATRVMALKIVHLKNGPSPEWLKTFLKLHGQNTINTLVDLTNYIMFMYGMPNHAFDTAKSTDDLIWQMNPKYQEFVSLDKTILKIDQNILMVNNPYKALSLSFWGGEACAIDDSTTNTIIEMAVYNPATVRQNSRQLKAVTEASIRLEKFLDPELIPTAITHLAQLIIENCGGQIGSQLFDYYPNPEIAPTIEFNPKLPSITSGIDIPEDFALDIVSRVGSRQDITQEEDLVEEVVRFYGYNKIPTHEPLTFKEVKNITPKEIYLIDEIKDKLVALGYDEVLTWPLVNAPTTKDTVITTQNSINSESIYLRQSLIPSLKLQLDQYSRYKLPEPMFFEIGRVFNQSGDKFIETNSLGIYHYQSKALQNDLEKLGLTANLVDGNFVEINLDLLPQPDNYKYQAVDNSAIELTSQIITLDANVTLPESHDPIELIKKYQSKIDSKILWQIEITDVYQDIKSNSYRYTFRVSYFNCDDKTAKEIHLTAFDLN